MGLLAWVAEDIEEEEEGDVSKTARVDLNKLMAGATKLTRDQQIRLAALRVAAWGMRGTADILFEAREFERFIRASDSGKVKSATRKKAR
ncbi:hypothetical protein LCGC14_0777360 [marine sediment metagenome]|uniref:Uncharacterized protein n=1 Tax=marine sediment metagenome TaxID=412755 RepID=A0A0F9SGB7_9ZZZZ